MELENGFDDFKPRLIVWQLQSEGESGGNGVHASPDHPHPPGLPLSTRECLLIIDAIARTSKPIVVLTGNTIMARPDLHQIVEYGVALGLKMILEAGPEELTEEVLRKFSQFGPRIFRILVGDVIVEDMQTRYRHSTRFEALEATVNRMNAAGFEVHLCVHLKKPDVRSLAFDHDYAMRRKVNGLYCHLSFGPSRRSNGKRRAADENLDLFIEEIAQMKSFSPDQMYFSPQCVRYGYHNAEHGQPADPDGFHHNATSWHHWCLAGRTYAFIGPDGTVRACAGLEPSCGNLRSNGFNFKKIWESASVFMRLRSDFRSCSQTRTLIKTPSPRQHHRNRQ